MNKKWYVMHIYSLEAEGWWPVELSDDELKVVTMVVKTQRRGAFEDTCASLDFVYDPFDNIRYLSFDTLAKADEYINGLWDIGF